MHNFTGKNAARYEEELKRLNDYARRVIGSIPKEQRILVTAHDAFNYMSRAYGIEVMGIQGLSTESEAGSRTSTASWTSWFAGASRRFCRNQRFGQERQGPDRRGGIAWPQGADWW